MACLNKCFLNGMLNLNDQGPGRCDSVFKKFFRAAFGISWTRASSTFSPFLWSSTISRDRVRLFSPENKNIRSWESLTGFQGSCSLVGGDNFFWETCLRFGMEFRGQRIRIDWNRVCQMSPAHLMVKNGSKSNLRNKVLDWFQSALKPHLPFCGAYLKNEAMWINS